MDTDQWCQAIASFGGKYATIVAKHVCGFTIWPTAAALPARNMTYDYTVPADRDILAAFAKSCKAVGVGLGVYYVRTDWTLGGPTAVLFGCRYAWRFSMHASWHCAHAVFT